MSHDSALLGELDLHLLGRGTHYQLYNVMGGRVATHEGVRGAKFTVWAPNARAVSLIGDFNGWNDKSHPMRVVGDSGVWEIFIPDVGEGALYKFAIWTRQGRLIYKTDPFAYAFELRPKTASMLFDLDGFEWSDRAWAPPMGPINIYEVHLGSWRKGLDYRELAHQLGSYCHEMGFSHVELMPVTEHPLDESWGYQVTGFFAPTSRFGSPRDFQYFVNHLHTLGIGVILDWVGAHFPTDDFGLAHFDGTALYEHEDRRQGFHPHWNTHIFNYGRNEVSNFLIASALFWLDKMHIDGLRLDAVASMLYLDYGREAGEWIPNIHGGHENLEAIEFLKHLNSIVKAHFPQALLCAEESTSFTGVSHPLQWNGLGFDLKWNMGWMNDTLRYFQRPPIFRHYHQNELTFGLTYAFSERFVLVLSHDEVVHGKGSLIAKMPGDDWQKFAQVRLLYSYMLCQPGKKLLFMGGEIGQWHEWNCKGELDWSLLNYERHRQLQGAIRELNHFYHATPSLWERDTDPSGFSWIDFSDTDNCVLSYLRKGEKGQVICLHNFSPNYHPHYAIELPNIRSIREVMNTDRVEYGGSGKINRVVSHDASRFVIELAPLATTIFEVEFE